MRKLFALMMPSVMLIFIIMNILHPVTAGADLNTKIIDGIEFVRIPEGFFDGIK